jgi:hypothetical protein
MFASGSNVFDGSDVIRFEDKSSRRRSLRGSKIPAGISLIRFPLKSSATTFCMPKNASLSRDVMELYGNESSLQSEHPVQDGVRENRPRDLLHVQLPQDCDMSQCERSKDKVMTMGHGQGGLPFSSSLSLPLPLSPPSSTLSPPLPLPLSSSPPHPHHHSKTASPHQRGLFAGSIRMTWRKGPACTKLLAVHTREGVGSNSQLAVQPASADGLQTSPANSTDWNLGHMIEGLSLTVMKTTSVHDVPQRLLPGGEGMTRPDPHANPFLLHQNPAKSSLLATCGRPPTPPVTFSSFSSGQRRVVGTRMCGVSGMKE